MATLYHHEVKKRTLYKQAKYELTSWFWTPRSIISCFHVFDRGDLSPNQRETHPPSSKKANIPGCYSTPHAQLNTLENLPAFPVSHDNMIKPESHDSGATNKHHHTRWTSFRQVSGVFYWRITAFWRQFLFYHRRRHFSLGHFELVPSLNPQTYQSECDRSAMRICKLDCPSFNVINHFTVVCLVAWPLNESEAGVDLILIETSLLLLCKFLLISIRTASLA